MAQPTRTDQPAQPVAGCDVCAALVKQREAARGRLDFSGVADCNVEIRRHPHGGKR